MKNRVALRYAVQGAMFLSYVISALAAAAQSYTLTDLGTFGGTFSVAYNVSNRGYVSGQANVLGDTATHPFLWQKGVMSDLGTLGGNNGIAFISNEKGQVVGPAETSVTDPYGGTACGFGTQLMCRAFLWQDRVMSDLGTLGGNNSWANWINSKGQVVGWAENRTLDPNTSLLGQRAFLFENGTMSDLGTLGGYNSSADGINDRGDMISGSSDTRKNVDPTLGFVPHHAALWTKGAISDLGTLGGGFSIAFVVNNHDQVVGFSTLHGDQHTHATLWQNGIHDLRTIGTDTDSMAFGINNLGQVVGATGSTITGVVRAFIWRDGVMTDLNTLCPLCAATGYELQFAFWINARGEIAASAVSADGQTHAVLLTPVNASLRAKVGGAKLQQGLRTMLLRKIGPAKINHLIWFNH